MPLLTLKEELSRDIAKILSHPEVTAETVFAEISTPPNLQMGHMAFPCFKLAKLMKREAFKIATELASKIQNEKRTASVAGPYVNVKWDVGTLSNLVLEKLRQEKGRYGSDTVGKGKKVVLEYCSPNIAKSLAFHHIRSILIGNTLSNVYRNLGFDVVRVNFVGDWGAQFARLLVAVEKWNDRVKLDSPNLKEAMDSLAEVYVRFHKELDHHQEWLEEARLALKKLEDSDTKAIALWTQIREISLKAMQETLSKMNVSFDVLEGESSYIAQIQPVIDEVKKKAGARLSEGAWIVEVEGFTTPALIQKKDGSTLYLTRDIAAAIDRYKRFQFHKMIYIVGEQQKLHFQLLFGVLQKMGYEWAQKCTHVGFGTVLFGSEKMSTRKGNDILLNEALNEATKRALAECTAKNPELANKTDVAEQVGLGAVIFGELSAHRGRDIEFDWAQVLSFEGETGPYVQYALVRCNSLLEKAGINAEISNGAITGYAFAPEEEQLIVVLGKMREVLNQVIVDDEPYHLTHYLIDVAKAFNRFYYRLPVLQANDPKQKETRLNLVIATRWVLLNSLQLLGMPCPKEM